MLDPLATTRPERTPYVLRDGLTLALYDWPRPSALMPRAQVLLVHGLGEHAWRYTALAHRLLRWGFAVRAYDQRGHGESAGERGRLPNAMALVDDLAEIIDDTRERSAPGLPLVLLGHSLGGLVASRLVATHERPVDGLVLSSPALDLPMSAWQRAWVGRLARWCPDWTVTWRSQPEKLSHDPAVVRAYRADPLVHQRLSARLGGFIASEGAVVRAAAAQWDTPTLLMYAGDDALVAPQGSASFAAQAPAECVSARRFDGYYHEIFNERHNEEVFDTLQWWLDHRF
jgi:alpha-beta hydrolase superfamily lysophospholipase